jgi:hypothetical protein
MYGNILTSDIPRAFPFPQSPSVDDMLSGVAWKDTPSCSIGGTGPYIPKMLLGKFDSEEERESRRKYYREREQVKRVRDGMIAVKMLKKDGIIADTVAEELESKVEDDHGTNRIAMLIQLLWTK